jgi:DNA repair exonuclease SbcCD ATPase subunit
VKFPELEIENFLALTEAKISLSDRGLVLIQGENNANTSATSNGSGKSSIADALCWCWFGTTARGVSGDDVVNNVAKKNTRVSSTVVDGAISYTATRYRKHKTGKNSLQIVMNDGFKETDLTKGTDKLTQEVANQIIGCSLEVFAGSIYAGQEKMPDLPALTDKNLKLLIEEAAGTTVLEGAYKKAREQMTAAQAKLTAATDMVERAKIRIDHTRNQRLALTEQIDNWDKARDARREAVKTQIGAMIPALKKLQEDISLFDVPAIEAEIAECDAKIAAVDAEQKKLRVLDMKTVEASGFVNSAAHRMALVEKEKSIIESELARIDHKVGCPCSECGRPMTEAELGTARANAQARLDLKAEEVMGVRADYDALVDAQKLAQSVRDEFAATMADISAVAAQRAARERELAGVNALISRQELTKTQAKNLRDQITTITAEVNPFEAQVSTVEEQLRTFEDECAELEAKALAAEGELAIEQEVVKVFAPSGVRAHILDEVTPFLNEQTAKYLTTLSDGNMEATWSTLTPDSKGVLKEKFTIDVTDVTGGDKFEALSGGEKRKARIATALALQDLVATRASKPIDLFIGDEIDDALDPAGLERLMLILEDKARERGSVFIISHNELRDHIRQVMVVEKQADKTTRIMETTA